MRFYSDTNPVIAKDTKPAVNLRRQSDQETMPSCCIFMCTHRNIWRNHERCIHTRPSLYVRPMYTLNGVVINNAVAARWQSQWDLRDLEHVNWYKCFENENEKGTTETENNVTLSKYRQLLWIRNGSNMFLLAGMFACFSHAWLAWEMNVLLLFE